ncbi:hypothetical protein ACIP88_05015 [Streptomyces uncialis]|uniref:hypothetical protein n=1 Tax=Streptomyces uncialis TaxID=1048205 RepID=UPI00382E38E5
MPKNDAYGQNVSYPVLSDSPNIETAFGTAVNGLVQRTVLRFTNANARSAALTGASAPRPGMITYLIAEDRYDRRDGDGVWRPLSPGSWRPFSWASGYGANTGSPGYRIINGEVQLRGTFRRTNGADLPTNDETRFGTIASEAQPVGGYRYFTAAGNFVNTNSVSHFTGRIGIAPDGAMIFIMPLGSKSEWLSLDGVRYSID